jgi:hypothetical protein
MTTIKAELDYLFFVLRDLRAANDLKKFRYFRRIYHVLKAIDIANNAEIDSVEYESEDTPETLIWFRATNLAAHKIGKDSKQTVSVVGVNLFVIHLSNRSGRFCGLQGYENPLGV